MKIKITILLATLIHLTAYTQNVASRKALKAYDAMHYSDAAVLFQEIVDKTGGTQDQLIKLADCYLKLHQYIDAELTLQKLFQKNPAQSQQVILKYAQVLAQNQRYEESQKYYEMYTLDNRGKVFSEAYKSINRFFRDSSSITVGFLPVNTLQSEYSPAIFENGLVFCSNRVSGTGVKMINGINNTPYSDLYFVEVNSILKSERISENVLSAQLDNIANSTFNHDYSPASSNDNNTIGHFDPNYLIPIGGVKESYVEAVSFNEKINTKFHEGPMCFTRNYDTIFFTRNSYYGGKRAKGQDKVTRLQIFFATRGPNGKYENVQPFPFNNPDYSVGHPAISPDGKRLYFVSDKKGGMGETDIYYSEIREHRFTEPVNVGPAINTAGSEMFPFVNKDGSMFFASNGHAGLGGLDIFRSDFQNNEFKSPNNLGYPLNTSKDDFGICSSDLNGTTGYFSSNRLRGRGDDNIYSYRDTRPQNVMIQGFIKVKHYDSDGRFYVEPLKDATVSISPLGEQVTTDRTGKYEFIVNRGKIYSIEGEKAELGKDKKEINLVKAPADKHIFQVDLIIEKSAPAFPYVGKVLDAESKIAVKGAYVYIYEVETDKVIKLVTDSSGLFTAQLHPNHSYILKSYAEGHFSDCYKVHASPKLTGQINAENFQLKKIQVNTTFEVKNLLYDYNKSEIRKDAAEVLDKVVRFLKEYPSIVVELGSHTDSRGTDDYNLKLSADRAKSAVEYIVSQGIDSNRISYKGYGETMLLNDCGNNANCPEEKHQENRRTEVKVTGIIETGDLKLEEIDLNPKEVFKYLSDFKDCREYRVGQ